MSYYITTKIEDADGMMFLRQVFPQGEANGYNFALFSTSGVHGSYMTIEQVENGEAENLTFLVIKPRIVQTIFGNCIPKTPDDFQFLKRLRKSSRAAVLDIIGKDTA